jgi:hypothetical protein
LTVVTVAPLPLGGSIPSAFRHLTHLEEAFSCILDLIVWKASPH